MPYVWFASTARLTVAWPGVITRICTRRSRAPITSPGRIVNEALCRSVVANSASTCADKTTSPTSPRSTIACAMRCFLASVGSYAYSSTLVSRKSGADIQVFPFPRVLPYFELVSTETVSQRLQFLALAPRSRILLRNLLQIIADQPGERGIALHRDFADLFDQLIVQRKGDIHRPIIRETLNKGNLLFGVFKEGRS